MADDAPQTRKHGQAAAQPIVTFDPYASQGEAMRYCHHDDCKHCERELSREITVDDLSVMSKDDLSRYLEIRADWLKRWVDWADGLVQHHDPLTRWGHDGLRMAITRRVEDRDDPQFDGTDGAHPAWWRGQRHGFEACMREIEKVIIDPFRTLTKGGQTQPEWQALRMRVAMMALNLGCVVAELAEARGQPDLRLGPAGAQVHVVCSGCGVAVGGVHLDTCEFATKVAP